MSTQTGVLDTPVEITKWTLKNNAVLSSNMIVQEDVTRSVLTPLPETGMKLYIKRIVNF